ncbi:MAG: 3-methyl-2-oxobutanoate hydroxymethyltransferase [Leptolinea sp.]|nr:3-methyl-2-oxobutanoate hydroxymethyltransferase [Leptolinea sp.]
MSEPAKMTVTRLLRKKRSGEKITMLTAYDFPMAKFINMAGVDIVLVSDAVGTVGLGRPEAVSVSVDEMIYHTQAVANGAGNAMVVTTMPFGTYETVDQAVVTGVRLMKEGHADGIHMEATAADAPKVKALVHAGVPVMGHLGITKQKIVRTGTIQIQGRTAANAGIAVADAVELANAGAFALVLECIPDRLGEIITRSLEIPTISIGAGVGCDGQALVTQDMLGMFKEMSPRFLKLYLDLTQTIVTALTQFRTEVEQGKFPGPEHTYVIDDEELGKLLTQLQNRSAQ